MPYRSVFLIANGAKPEDLLDELDLEEFASVLKPLFGGDLWRFFDRLIAADDPQSVLSFYSPISINYHFSSFSCSIRPSFHTYSFSSSYRCELKLMIE